MIESLLSRAELLFVLLLHAAWQAGLLALIVLALGWLLLGRLHARWRFALWMVVFARLALPILPAAPWSLFGLFPGRSAERVADHVPAASSEPDVADMVQAVEPPETGVLPTAGPADGASGPMLPPPVADNLPFEDSRSMFPRSEGSATAVGIAADVEPTRDTEAASSPPAEIPWLRIAAVLWLMGVVLLAARYVATSLRFRKERRGWQPVTGPVTWTSLSETRRVSERRGHVQAALESCRREIRLRRNVRLVLSPGNVGPATCGILRPCIVLPKRLAESLSPAELRLVLLHELIHVRRLDVLWDRLATLVAIVHWFHPVGWLARFLLRKDRELACDATVLDCSGEQTASGYGHVILKTVQALITPSPLPGLVGMFSRRHRSFLERRIRMIADYRKGTWSGLAGGAALLLVVALVGLTDAETPQTKPSQEIELPVAADLDGEPQAPEPPGKASPMPETPPSTKASLGGTVVDEEGRPVSKASVWLVQHVDEAQRFRNLAADSQGRFSFVDVEPDSATVAVVTERHSLGAFRYSLRPGQAESSLRLIVTQPRELVLRIVDESGKPVSDVELQTLYWTKPGSQKVWFPLDVLRRERLPLPRSDRRGEMLISGVPSGVECQLQLAHPEFAVRQIEDVPTDKAEPVPVALKPGAPLTVEAVVAATGDPARDARVSVSVHPGNLHLSGTLDDKGKWTVRLPDARSVSVTVRHPQLISLENFAVRDWFDDAGRPDRPIRAAP